MSDATSSTDRVSQYVQRIAAGPEFPALSERIRDVVHVLSGEDQTMQHLANVILKDYSLTTKVLRTANSFHYNRAGRPILSVTQAMVLLGMDSVRDLASSLLVFEHYQGRSQGLKELMILSMLTASHARHAAERAGYSRPEEAHLLGMFRNLGEVLVACHAPDDYAAVQARLAHGDRAGDACLRVLGFPFEDLGRAVCELWAIPVTGPNALAQDRRLLEDIVAFSHDLTTAVYRRATHDAATTVEGLVHRHGAALDLTDDAVSAILDSGLAETRDVFDSLGVAINDLTLRRLRDAAVTGPAVAGTPAAAPEIVVPPVDGAPVRERLLEPVEAALGGGPFDLNQVLLTVLEAVFRGGPCDHAVFCLSTADRSEVAGRFGLGEDVEGRLAAMRFRVSLARSAAPAGPALARGADLVVFSTGAVSVEEAHLLRRLRVSTLLLLPVIVDGRLIGAVYADRVNGHPAPDPAALAFFRRVRTLAARAIARARNRADASPLSAGVSPAAPGASPACPVSPGGSQVAAVGPGSAATPVAPATRCEAVLRVLRGESPHLVGRDLGVPGAEVAAWRDAFLAGAPPALEAP